MAAFARSSGHAKFTEIDVERINVVEPDGKYRLVISNRPRSIGAVYKMQSFGYAGGNRPGLIWFNDEGTENGGMTFTGRLHGGAIGHAAATARTAATARRRTCRSINSTRTRSSTWTTATTTAEADGIHDQRSREHRHQQMWTSGIRS